MSVSPSDWVKGITLSVIATIIGGASKLAIRKSWLLMNNVPEEEEWISSMVNESASQSQSQSDCTEGHRRPHHAMYVGGQQNASEELSNSNNQNPNEGHLLGADEDANDNSNDDELVLSTKPSTMMAAYCLRFSGMMGMTIWNPLCGVLAMNYASPSITAPFSGLTLVWIVIFSDMLIGERPSCMQIIAASLIVLGEVVVAIFGDHTNDSGITTLSDLEQSYREPVFLAFLIAITLWMALLLYWMHYSHSTVIQRFAWGVSGGSMTGIQNFMKDSLTILKAAHRHDHDGHEEDERIPWYFPIFIILAMAMAFGGLLCLTGCMKRYDVTYSSSSFVGAYVVCASIMSAAHYHTFEHLETVINYVMYPCGLLILMTGVWILVRQEADVPSVPQHDPITTTPSLVSIQRHAHVVCAAFWLTFPCKRIPFLYLERSITKS
jgi:drug/metabolite transporter (DMT)-like permease